MNASQELIAELQRKFNAAIRQHDELTLTQQNRMIQPVSSQRKGMISEHRVSILQPVAMCLASPPSQQKGHTMTRKDLISVALGATLLLLPGRAQAAPTQAKAACYITTLKGGQYAVQTAGATGTLNAYVNEVYVTTISKLDQAWYLTKDKKARVAVYDNGSKRVC